MVVVPVSSYDWGVRASLFGRVFLVWAAEVDIGIDLLVGMCDVLAGVLACQRRLLRAATQAGGQ